MDNKDTIREYFRGRYDQFYGKYLPGIKKIGQRNEYQALCPFHEDKNPSFTLNADTGEYFCHGCGKKGHAFHFYAKVNSLDTKRDFPKILRGIASDFNIPIEETALRFVKAYDYTDVEGKLLFQVCRYEPKTFKQRIPDGPGKRKYGLNGTTPVLYRLPQIVKAQEVCIVEGEKDVETIEALGFTATTSPMGARKWRPGYSDYLKGKDVTLIPDNDTEGREHMAQVGAALNGIAKSLKWLDLPDLPSKGDVSDWAATIPNKTQAGERLAIMLESAKPYIPPKKVTLEDCVIESGDFSRLDIPRKRKILDIFSEQEIILVAGWRGTGKTWAALSIADAVTRGGSFGPWKVHFSVPCLYCDGEMASGDIRDRLAQLNPATDRKSPLYIYSDAYANHLGLPRANLLSETWRTTMKRILTTRGVKFWVVDNIASLAGGIDENAKKDWDPINTWLLDLRFTGITTLLLHHVGRAGNQRGTSAREDNIDMSILLKQPPDYEPEQGACFILTFSKTRIASDDLSLLQETKFRLTQSDQGRLIWTFGSVKQETRQTVLGMIDQGTSYDDIAAALGITKGRISQIKADAISKGIMDHKGHFKD